MSILWDEQQNRTGLDSEELLKRFSSLLAEYQKETSSPSDGTLFVGLATGSDKELLHILLNMSPETRFQILAYARELIGNDPLRHNEDPAKPTLKKVLPASSHKDLKISIVRPVEKGRDIQEWDF
jgi:hypothetical protein